MWWMQHPTEKTCWDRWWIEAKRAGLKMGFYYSQAQDWNHPGGAGVQDTGKVRDGMRPTEGDFDKYLEKYCTSPDQGDP